MARPERLPASTMLMTLDNIIAQLVPPLTVEDFDNIVTVFMETIDEYMRRENIRENPSIKHITTAITNDLELMERARRDSTVPRYVINNYKTQLQKIRVNLQSAFTGGSKSTNQMSWVEALKQWNTKNTHWCIPRKGTEDYNEVVRIMKGL